MNCAYIDTNNNGEEILRELDPDGYAAYLQGYEKQYGTREDANEK